MQSDDYLKVRVHYSFMEGKCKGAIYKGNIEYVTKKYGKQGLQKLMDDMKKHGYRLDLESMKDGLWYTLDARMQFLRSTAELFELDDEQLIELGRSGFKKSAIAQLYLKIAGSPKKMFEMGPGIWKHNYDVGTLGSEYNGDTGSYFRVVDFDAPPIFFRYLIGYYLAAFEQVGVSNVSVEYNEVEKDGKPCHEYHIQWD